LADYTKKSSLGQQMNAKKSTNIGDDNWLDEYDNIFKDEGTQNFKFTITNFDKKRTSKESSILLVYIKYYFIYI